MHVDIKDGETWRPMSRGEGGSSVQTVVVDDNSDERRLLYVVKDADLGETIKMLNERFPPKTRMTIIEPGYGIYRDGIPIVSIQSLDQIDTTSIEGETAIALQRKANQLFKLGDYEKAINVYTAALKTDGSDDIKHMLYSNRALCRSKLGDHETAFKDANLCCEAKPGFVKGIMRFVSEAIELGRNEQAHSKIYHQPKDFQMTPAERGALCELLKKAKPIPDYMDECYDLVMDDEALRWREYWVDACLKLRQVMLSELFMCEQRSNLDLKGTFCFFLFFV